MTTRYLVLAIAGALFATSAAAHDPSKHAKDKAAANAKPDCTAMKDMDHSKADPKDPVMQALHKKCAAEGGHVKDSSTAPAPATAPPTTKDKHGDH